MLQASSYWRPGEPVQVDFAPETDGQTDCLHALRGAGARRDAAAFKQALRAVLPQRMADHLAEVGAPDGWTNAALEAAERELRAGRFIP